MLLSHGTKSRNNKKIPYLKIYPPIKLKQLSVIFILNYNNNFIDPTEIYITVLVPQIFQILSTLVRFLFTALSCCHLIADVMILLIVSSLLKSLSFFFFFNKKKLVFYCIMLRAIPLGLAVLCRYCPLTLENILSLA